jgi:hypothetical protein
VTLSPGLDEQRLAELLGRLPPAPKGWVEAAQQLPDARRQLDQLVELAALDAQFAQALRSDLEGALRSRDVTLPARLRVELRSRIDRG